MFLHALAGIDDVRVVKDRNYPGGFSVALTLSPKGLRAHAVIIAFSRGRPLEPRVRVDGPTDSPHRYQNGDLCMWCPQDPAEKRWTLKDGAAALVANIAAHLIREEWYRLTGEWIGDEVHPSPRDSENDPINRRETE